MEHNVMNLTFVLAMCMTMTLVLIFPGISFELWLLPMKKWERYKRRRLTKKSKLVEGKLKKYVEIDMTKLR